MQTIQELRGRVQAQVSAAQHMLAEKGEQRWSFADQLAFDALLDDADRSQSAIDAKALRAHHSHSLRADEHSALELYLRKPGAHLSASEMKRVRNAMSTTTPAEGGYAVGPWMAQEVISSLKGYGFMRQVAQEYTTSQSGGSGSFPSSDGSAEVGEQLAENAAADLADPTFGTVLIPTYRFSSRLFTVPIELLQDSAVDIVSFVLQRARDRIGRIQNQRFTTGTGTSQPTGLMVAASVGKTGTTGQTTTIIYDDLVDLVDSVDEAHLGMPNSQSGMPATRPGWMFSQTMRKVIRKIKDTNGRPVWMPGHDDEAGRAHPAQLLDYPVYINNDMAVPAANARSLAFGNLARYAIRDALDVTLYRFDDSAFALKGQAGFISYARAGGNLTDVGAVKTYQHPAT